VLGGYSRAHLWENTNALFLKAWADVQQHYTVNVSEVATLSKFSVI